MHSVTIYVVACLVAVAVAVPLTKSVQTKDLELIDALELQDSLPNTESSARKARGLGIGFGGVGVNVGLVGVGVGYPAYGYGGYGGGYGSYPGYYSGYQSYYNVPSYYSGYGYQHGYYG